MTDLELLVSLIARAADRDTKLWRANVAVRRKIKARPRSAFNPGLLRLVESCSPRQLVLFENWRTRSLRLGVSVTAKDMHEYLEEIREAA